MSAREAVAILGGVFDPVHHGHLRIALEVQQALGLSQVRLLPCGTPPHRGAPQADVRQRLRMLRAAIAGVPELVIDERELRRSGPSYMVDTAASLRAELGAAPLCLILGMDAFLGLHAWHEWQRLCTLLHLVVTHRPGWQPPVETQPAPQIAHLLQERQVFDPSALLDAPAGGIMLLPVTQLDISSTYIRQLVAEGRSPRYLLPEAAVEIIGQEGLYRNNR